MRRIFGPTRRRWPLKATAALAAALIAAGCVEAKQEPLRSPCAPVATRPSTPGSPLAFVEDGFARARYEARAKGKLLFVDGWAPWCHTCLSMRREVLLRPELGPLAKDFVFAALDTDREENAEFVGRFPMKAWPTFFVIDPVDLRIVALHGGSLSLSEMRSFLDLSLAARAASGADAERGKILSEAHALFSARDFVGAAALYERAAEVRWPRRNEALLGAMRTFSAAKMDERCRLFGMKHIADVEGTSPPSDFLYYLRDCGARAQSPQKEAVLDATLERLRALARDPPSGSSVDDRADVLEMLAEAETDAGHAEAARHDHEERLALLLAAAEAARSPEEARVFDYARMGSYLALGRGDEAVAMFEERCRQLPESYEAWARLASTLHTLHRDHDALGAVTKAIALSYGPRRLRYLALRGDIELGLGDRDAQIVTLGLEVKGHESLPAGQADPDKVADAKKRLAAALEARDAATRPDTSRTTPSR